VISQTGVISLGLIGPVQADGVTVAALENAIAEKLRNGYLRDPRVSVEVLTYRPFYILGEVRNPNSYPYSPGLTVARAVATAQGYTYRANQTRVFIKRGSDQETAYPTEGTVILPGDIVRVPERFF
jgi:protein involved in polysaccharide export with SLBB domain